MARIVFLLFIGCTLLGCTDSSNDSQSDRYKKDFLKLAEFDCEGITSNHYIRALIENNDFCTNTDNDIKNQVHLFNSFTTSSPSTDSSGIVEGSTFSFIWFGVFPDFIENARIKHFYFESKAYPAGTSKYDIAADVFVEGKVWPVFGSDSGDESISVLYRYTDGRAGYNTSHYADSEYGPQNGKSVIFDKVTITKDQEYIYYDIEMTFEADLYLQPFTDFETNLWAEVREGKLVANFKVKI